MNDNNIIIRKSIVSDLEELINFGKESFTKTFGHLYPTEDLIAYLNESYHNDKFLKYIEDNNKYSLYIAINKDNNNNNNNDKIVGYILILNEINH